MESSINSKLDLAQDENFKKVWNYIPPEDWTRQYLSKAATELRLPRPRSLAWAILLEALPAPHHSILARLKQHRKSYEELRAEFTKDPRTVPGDDPLSQRDESVWKQHFCDNELKALILQDVLRTFPEEPHFRQKHVQDLMVRVLFVWARSHALGYRQGMHEILAPLLFELYTDRIFLYRDRLSEMLQEVLNPEYLEHDSHMLFCAIMSGVECFYSTGDCVPNACGRMPLSTSTHNSSEVLRYLERIREGQLAPLDPTLASHLHDCNISLELFGIRWLRLLFGREFPRADVPLLWGFLFADGAAMQRVQYVFLATLISMRGTLLGQDAGAVLSTLMRPAAHVHHVVSLALHLREPLLYPRPSTPDPPTCTAECRLEEKGFVGNTDDSAADLGVPEGSDVARELATLAFVRAQLPRAAAALAAALPAKNHPSVAQPLAHILQLSALLQCRNHALIDVETALEADEGQATNKTFKRQLIPVNVTLDSSNKQTRSKRYVAQAREVPLKVFNQVECALGDSEFPCLDPLRLRTE